MNRSIRLRIALAVFAVVVSLVALQIVYVLERFKYTLTEEVDDRLFEGLADLRVVLAAGNAQDWIDQTMAAQKTENEMFVEVRDADGKLVARSANIPATGFPNALEIAHGAPPRFWEFRDPRGKRTSSRRVRALETWVGDYRVNIGMSLKEVQRWYWGLRKNLVSSLVALSVAVALSAYVVAARSLRPVSRIAAQARALGGLSDGVLPRTGSGDEIDRLAAVLNDLLQRIREEVMRVRRLTADAAHALRTPLTAIRGHLELDAAGENGASEPVEIAIEQVDDLIRFVNRLLFLEKLESGLAEPVAREKLDLLALARALVDHLRVIAEERSISLDCLGESAWIEGDAGQLRQAILNLVDNALRHTPSGGKVAVEVGVRGGAAELVVTDTGRGLPPDQLERVFERFYSTRAGSGAGTGLGLPIARAIARTHGGDVTATSPGGARFVLRVPLAGAA
ncbi:MAG TPA: ATP-binding protein [Myxococcota bacterium]|nr:ATP-binding protein [Myxococcota bacterium]